MQPEQNSTPKGKSLPEWTVGAGLIAANFFFGSNVIAVKHISPRLIEPAGLSFSRMFFSALLFLMLTGFKKESTKIERKDYPKMLLAALLGITGNQLFSIYGISLTNPIHASLLILSTPIIVSVLATLILKEQFGLNKFVGLLLGISGAILLILMRDNSSSRTATLQGDLMVICGAACYSGYLILIKSFSDKYSTISILKIVFILGAICSLPITIKPFLSAHWGQFQFEDWYSIFHVVILATFCAYLLMNYGVTRWGPSKTGSFIYFQPLFGTLSAIVMVNQTLNATILAAAGLIILGVIVTMRK